MFARTGTACCALALLVLWVGVAPVCGEVKFEWAAVDRDLGNVGDLDEAGFGSVSYAYWISKHEVTVGQYAGFLNAVDPAGTNGLGLYHSGMSGVRVGITLTPGNAEGSRYVVNTGRDRHPVAYVDFYDTLRFANWLHNGQGGGDTEDGAYRLDGGTRVPSNGATVVRNLEADYFLTSESEWYKAAYYDPDTDSYFDYATSSDVLPVAEAPPGATDGGENSANYSDVVGNTTEVGAYVNSASPFGTFDQSGNLWEWNESFFPGTTSRVLRGGVWSFSPVFLPASHRTVGAPASEIFSVGFRVASRLEQEVPEPGSVLCLVVGGAGVLMRRGRRWV